MSWMPPPWRSTGGGGAPKAMGWPCARGGGTRRVRVTCGRWSRCPRAHPRRSAICTGTWHPSSRSAPGRRPASRVCAVVRGFGGRAGPGGPSHARPGGCGMGHRCRRGCVVACCAWRPLTRFSVRRAPRWQPRGGLSCRPRPTCGSTRCARGGGAQGGGARGHGWWCWHLLAGARARIVGKWAAERVARRRRITAVHVRGHKGAPRRATGTGAG